MKRFLLRHLPPIILFLTLLSVYYSTMARGLTWANGGSDGGDLIAAAATGGIAHPTGYPLYLLLARLFQILPAGNLAFRTNLMSALATALAAGFVYSLVSSVGSKTKPVRRWLAGLTAGFAFGLAPLVWSQAVITEVYALQGLLTLLILLLYTKPVESASRPDAARISRWRGLALGLGMGNHLTTILLLPVCLLIGSMQSGPEREQSAQDDSSWLPSLRLDGTLLSTQLVWFGLGFFLYLMLPLRALSHPPINWGNAVTPERLWWLVSGSTYQGYYLQFTPSGLGEHLQTAASLLWGQFGLLGIGLASLGLVVFSSRSRLYALTLWMTGTSFAFTLLYQPEDWRVYLIPIVISFAIWIGLGVNGLASVLSARHSSLGLGLGVLLIAYFLGRSVVYGRQVDASQDLRAESFGREVLAAAPEGAMIFAEGDRAVFALWYFHFALHERPDLAVMASDLLHYDWYQETLQSTYPTLVIPGPFPWPESMAFANPRRPVCYAQYAGQTEMNCNQPLTAR
jgi:Protein of unknown function (DUF2723)